MMNTWALCALWVGLALVATLLAIWFKISTALSEIVIGTVAQLVIGVFLTGFFGFAQGGLAGNTQWITFLAGTGAMSCSFIERRFGDEDREPSKREREGPLWSSAELAG